MNNPYPEKEIFIKYPDGCIMYLDGTVFVPKDVMDIDEEQLTDDPEND